MDFERKRVENVDWEFDPQVAEEEEEISEMNPVFFRHVCDNVRRVMSDGFWLTVEDVAQYVGQSNVVAAHAIETLTKNTQNVLCVREGNSVVYKMGRPRN